MVADVWLSELHACVHELLPGAYTTKHILQSISVKEKEANIFVSIKSKSQWHSRPRFTSPSPPYIKQSYPKLYTVPLSFPFSPTKSIHPPRNAFEKRPSLPAPIKTGFPHPWGSNRKHTFCLISDKASHPTLIFSGKKKKGLYLFLLFCPLEKR